VALADRSQLFPALAALTVSVAALVTLPLWLLFGSRYTLTDSELLVRLGPKTWRFSLKEIRDVTPHPKVTFHSGTWSKPSFLSLSKHAIQIEYAPYCYIYVSPERPEEFVSQLKARVVSAT
jgi:hypothetical protein